MRGHRNRHHRSWKHLRFHWLNHESDLDPLPIAAAIHRGLHQLRCNDGTTHFAKTSSVCHREGMVDMACSLLLINAASRAKCTITGLSGWATPTCKTHCRRRMFAKLQHPSIWTKFLLIAIIKFTEAFNEMKCANSNSYKIHICKFHAIVIIIK